MARPYENWGRGRNNMQSIQATAPKKKETKGKRNKKKKMQARKKNKENAKLLVP